MAGWTELMRVAPDLAAVGRRLLSESHGYAYLATIDVHGHPRVRPVAPIVGRDFVALAVKVGSPKLEDLRARGRFALHATVKPPSDEEFAVFGSTREVLDESRRSLLAAQASSGAAVSEQMVLFDLEIERIDWAFWNHSRPTRRIWESA